MTEEERIRRIYRVAELAKEGMSTRQIADYLSTNEFKISNVTVLDYLNRFAKINPSEYELISEKIEKNKVKTIRNSKEVQERVKKVIQLSLKGFTIDEIAMALKEKPLTIYRDLRQRINNLTDEEKNELGFGDIELQIINQFMQEHSSQNLKRR